MDFKRELLVLTLGLSLPALLGILGYRPNPFWIFFFLKRKMRIKKEGSFIYLFIYLFFITEIKETLRELYLYILFPCLVTVRTLYMIIFMSLLGKVISHTSLLAFIFPILLLCSNGPGKNYFDFCHSSIIGFVLSLWERLGKNPFRWIWSNWLDLQHERLAHWKKLQT